MKIRRPQPIPFLVLVSLLGQVGNSRGIHSDVSGIVPKQGKVSRFVLEDLPKNKIGEDVAAHTHGRWRWYKQNPPTLSERKNRPPSRSLSHHGGWYDRCLPGFQPRNGNFHLANAFGVWEHDPTRNRLLFRFNWPRGMPCKYDPVNDCFWGIFRGSSSGTLVAFHRDKLGKPSSVGVYSSPFRLYCYTDKKGRAWFVPKAYATYNEGEVRIFQYKASPIKKIGESLSKALLMERALQKKQEEFELLRKSNSGPKRASFLENDFGRVMEVYPEFGISFDLIHENATWYSFDRDGRKWIHGKELYCYDDTEITAPSYEEFESLLPAVLSKDPKVATNAMRRLVRAKKYLRWVRKNLKHKNRATRDAAQKLTACLDEENRWMLTGDWVAWKAMKDDPESAPDEALPIPEQNKDDYEKFVETSPLVLDTSKAGVFSNVELIEEPMLDHPFFKLTTTGHSLRSVTEECEYFQITCGKKLNLIPRKAPKPIFEFGQTNDPNRQAVLLREDDDTLAAGILDIASDKFQKLGEISRKKRFDYRPLIDDAGRMILVSGMGEIISYQKKRKGTFTHLELPPPKTASRSGVISVGSDKFIFRNLFEERYSNPHSDILKFKNGNVIPLETRIEGGIYNMDWVTKKVLLVATTDPEDILFVNHETDCLPPPLFQLKKTPVRRRFWTDSVHDHQGRFWFVTTWGPNKTTQAFRLHYYGKNKLKVLHEWSIPAEDYTLNPYRGNMCITGDGRIWLSFPEHMLVVDTKTLDYRFFRTFDRSGIAILFPNKNWCIAKYGINKTAFHLKSLSGEK